MTSRPASRITIGEAYYDLMDNYATLKERIINSDPQEHVAVSRHDNGKDMTVRVGAIDTVQEMGY